MSVESPLAYLNDGRNRFRAMPPEPFAGDDRDFGWFAVPLHADDDAAINFVAARSRPSSSSGCWSMSMIHHTALDEGPAAAQGPESPHSRGKSLPGEPSWLMMIPRHVSEAGNTSRAPLLVRL